MTNGLLFEDSDLTKEASIQCSSPPLAYAMAPNRLVDYVGQLDILGEGKLLRRLLKNKQMVSCIFWGPPGCGKTSLVRIIGNELGIDSVSLNAVAAKIADLQTVIQTANRRAALGKRTLLFIDEIHRFTKTQQDVLLPVVEQGVITLIGATTENPYFSVIPGLISRCKIMELVPLSESESNQILERAFSHYDSPPAIDQSIKDLIVRYGNGDARKLLNGVELLIMAHQDGVLSFEDASLILQQTGHPHNDDSHYDLASALIKSLRHSDPDAALYWLACLLEGGEDPRFIGRRLIIFASEDIGNADPAALNLTVSVFTAVQQIGMPEARIHLAHAVTYLASSPKSNASYQAFGRAQAFLRQQSRPYSVPHSLKDSHYAGAKALGHGMGYLNPHECSDGVAYQVCWPGTETFYHPKRVGQETSIHDYLVRVASLKLKARDSQGVFTEKNGV